MLPKLKEQCSSRAIPLEDLLSETGYDKILEIVPNLDCIGDLKVCLNSSLNDTI